MRYPVLNLMMKMAAGEPLPTVPLAPAPPPAPSVPETPGLMGKIKGTLGNVAGSVMKSVEDNPLVQKSEEALFNQVYDARVKDLPPDYKDMFRTAANPGKNLSRFIGPGVSFNQDAYLKDLDARAAAAQTAGTPDQLEEAGKLRALRRYMSAPDGVDRNWALLGVDRPATAGQPGTPVENMLNNPVVRRQAGRWQWSKSFGENVQRAATDLVPYLDASNKSPDAITQRQGISRLASSTGWNVGDQHLDMIAKMAPATRTRAVAMLAAKASGQPLNLSFDDLQTMAADPAARSLGMQMFGQWAGQDWKRMAAIGVAGALAAGGILYGINSLGDMLGGDDEDEGEDGEQAAARAVRVQQTKALTGPDAIMQEFYTRFPGMKQYG